MSMDIIHKLNDAAYRASMIIRRLEGAKSEIDKFNIVNKSTDYDMNKALGISLGFAYSELCNIAKSLLRDPNSSNNSPRLLELSAANTLGAASNKILKYSSPWQGKKPPRALIVNILGLVDIYNWYVAGAKMYEVSLALAEKLLHTVIKGLPVSEIRLPYSYTAIKIPQALFPDIHDGVAYLTMFDSPDFSDSLEAILMVQEPDPIAIMGRNWWREATFKRNVPVEDIGIRIREHGFKGDEEEKIVTPDLIRWCFNVCLYATMTGAEIEDSFGVKVRHLEEKLKQFKKGVKRDKLKAQLEALKNEGSLLKLGSSVQVMKTIGTAESETGTRAKLNYRILVAGHWKMQFHGENRALRKRIFIEPYWKGPELGGIVNKTHVCSEGGYHENT